jgi:hypothetical protein
MSDGDLEAKFRDLVEPVLAPARVDELISLCWDMENVSNVDAIARAATPS